MFVPLAEEDHVRKYLSKLAICKSMGPDVIYPRVLRELEDVIAKLLSKIFGQSRQLREALKDWRQGNVTLIFRMGEKEETEDYRLVSLTLIPRKAVEQLILETGMKVKSSGVVSMPLSEEVKLDQPDKLL